MRLNELSSSKDTYRTARFNTLMDKAGIALSYRDALSHSILSDKIDDLSDEQVLQNINAAFRKRLPTKVW